MVLHYGARDRAQAIQARVACSAGAACHAVAKAHVSHVLVAMAVPHEVAIATLRLSLGRGTSPGEVDAAAAVIASAVRALVCRARGVIPRTALAYLADAAVCEGRAVVADIRGAPAAEPLLDGWPSLVVRDGMGARECAHGDVTAAATRARRLRMRRYFTTRAAVCVCVWLRV